MPESERLKMAAQDVAAHVEFRPPSENSLIFSSSSRTGYCYPSWHSERYFIHRRPYGIQEDVDEDMEYPSSVGTPVPYEQ